jgi:peptidoglycan/LPS O-acetylase OafA/YrhL
MNSSKKEALRMTHLDGIRGIAVLAVVFYHYFPNINLFRGGFIGVDIFFVLSGYLITRSLQENTFTRSKAIKDFYIKRVRRIFPSLIAIFSFGSLIAVTMMNKTQLIDFGNELFHATTFSSNFLYQSQAGYFDVSHNLKPLLHLWSLSIEEQFYILWPIFFLVLHKKKKMLLICTSAFIISGIMFSVSITNTNPTLAFYSPLSRSWEILAGSLFAIIHKENSNRALFKKVKTKRVREVLSILAFVLIAYSLCRINPDENYPGIQNIIPVIGSGILIFAPQAGNRSYKILSSKILVFFGNISYPLYLFHWIILSLYRIVVNPNTSIQENIFLFVLSILIATLTFSFIETPLRFSWSSKKASTFLLSFFIFFFTLSMFFQNGYPSAASTFRYGGDTYQGRIGFKEMTPYIDGRGLRCNIGKGAKYEISGVGVGNVECIESKKGTLPRIALVGDSHAGDLFAGISESLPEENILNLLLYGTQGFPATDNPNFAPALKYLGNSSIETVIFSKMWSNPGDSLLEGGNVQRFSRVIDYLVNKGKEVYIFDGRPYFTFDPQYCKYAGKKESLRKCSENSLYFFEQYNAYKKELIILEKSHESIHLINLVSLFCEKGTCRMNDGDKLLFADRSHFNLLGSRFVGSWLVREYPNLQKSP